MFYIDWYFCVSFYSDVFYFIFVWSFVFLFLDFYVSYLRFGFFSFVVVVDKFFTRFLLDDMDFVWDVKGGCKYNFLFFFSFLNYFSFVFYQFTWLHFSLLFDLFSLFLFMWPLFFCYLFSFFLEYGFSFSTFMIGNSWVRVWYFSDLFEWFGYYFSSFLRFYVLGDCLYTRLICFSFFSVFWPLLYFYVLFVSFVYLIYIPIACFVRYVAVFTALSVLWNVWVTSSFSILTNCFGFYSSFVVLPAWFFFCTLFLSFEGSYVLIHIVLLNMLYVKIVSVVLSHKKKFSVLSSSSSFSTYFSFI